MHLIEGQDDSRWVLYPSEKISCKSLLNSFYLTNSPSSPFFKCYLEGTLALKSSRLLLAFDFGELLTCDALQTRFPHNLPSRNQCVLCRNKSEDLNHTFLHCPFSLRPKYRVLNKLGLCHCRSVTYFCVILVALFVIKGKTLRCFIVPDLCRSLWLERNWRIFNDEEDSLEEG